MRASRDAAAADDRASQHARPEMAEMGKGMHALAAKASAQERKTDELNLLRRAIEYGHGHNIGAKAGLKTGM